MPSEKLIVQRPKAAAVAQRGKEGNNNELKSRRRPQYMYIYMHSLITVLLCQSKCLLTMAGYAKTATAWHWHRSTEAIKCSFVTRTFSQKAAKRKKKSNYGIYYYQNLKQQKNSFKIFMTLLLSGKKKK